MPPAQILGAREGVTGLVVYRQAVYRVIEPSGCAWPSVNSR